MSIGGLPFKQRVYNGVGYPLFIFAPGVLAALWTAIKAIGTFLAVTGLSSVVAVGTVFYAASSLLASRIF